MGADNKATLEENFQTLLDLEMPPDERTTYLYNLEPTDYYQGPGKNDYDDQEGFPL